MPGSASLPQLRLAAFDAYQARMPRARQSTAVVIVAIDEASLRRFGQWPWPRSRLAELVGRLAASRPATIGIDLLMAEPDRLSPGRLPELIGRMDPDLARTLSSLPSNDTVLAEALRGRPVVVGVAGVDDRGFDATLGIPQAPVRIVGGDPTVFLRRFEGWLRSIEEIDRAAAGRGLLNVDPERGVVRRVPLVAAIGSTVVPALGIEMLRVAAGQPAFSIRVGRTGVEAVGVGDLVVRSAADGSVWLRYAPFDPTRIISAAEVLAGRVEPQILEGKLVLVGVTALGLGDSPATPLGESLSGVEIHAQLLEGIIDGKLLSRPRWVGWVEAGLLSVGGLLLIMVVPRVGARAAVGLLAGLIGAVIGLGWVLYLKGGLLLDGATPSLALGGLFTAMLAISLTDAQSQRRVLRLQIEEQRQAAARLAGELEAARRIQMGSLPLPELALSGEHRVDLYALLEPAREVGGDLYDFFRLDQDRLFFLVGDVSGKGLPSSLFMAVSKALYKSTALRQTGEIAAMMREADDEISRDNGEGLFVTVLAGILDAATGELEYANAGHEPAYLLPRAGRPLVRLSDGAGPPLCAVDHFPYEARRHPLEPGDTLCVITDGVTEATRTGGELYGRKRLETFLESLGGTPSAREVGEALRHDVARFTNGAERSDDLAILVLRWIGPGASGR
jgi:serine phosphatase RsbU (regulator of sigma subunit)